MYIFDHSLSPDVPSCQFPWKFPCIKSSYYGNQMAAPKVTELYLLSFHLLLISLQGRSKKTRGVLSLLHLQSPQERLSLKLVTWNLCFILYGPLLVMHVFYNFCHHIREWMCTFFFLTSVQEWSKSFGTSSHHPAALKLAFLIEWLHSLCWKLLFYIIIFQHIQCKKNIIYFML